ncbi:MAG TPA: protein kinase [Kofleriaceae bacterium]|nr:protein kinase [Kofleriaceae bacterium]
MATRFGAYEIVYELKAGGMGAVLLGRRRGLGAFDQLVAIKTIRPEYASTQAVRAMFLDEAAILARLNHPGVATVHDFGEEGGTLYMVMEYVAGLSFRDIEDLRPPPAVAARAIAEACRGLHAAHELRDLSGSILGVVHRDISPDNLMLGYDGHVKVIDFGIALVKNRQAPVTEFGTVKGKPPYMSPEQVKNAALDGRSDVFSLAVVLWELLTHRSLFDGDSIYAIARAVEHQEIEPPSKVLGSPLPNGLDSVVMAALDRDLARRTPSAAELAEQLERVIAVAGDETLEAWADRELEQPRLEHRAWLARVVGARDTTPAALGRPTGAVTALSPLARSPDAPTHLPDATDDRGPRRRLVLPLVAGLVVLFAIGGGIYLTRHGSTPPVHPDAPAPIVIPSRPDAPPPIDAVSIDAPIMIDAPIDAPRHTGPHDARPAPHDVARSDAPAAIAPQGRGLLIVSHPSSPYLQVIVDGRYLGPTPMLKGTPIAAGPHTITLVHPTTNEVVLTRSVVVRDGETITIE